MDGNGRVRSSRPRALAFPARDRRPDERGTPVGGQHPGTQLPWRLVAHVLPVTAFELGHPVAVLVLMKAGDAPFGNHESTCGPWTFAPQGALHEKLAARAEAGATTITKAAAT